MSKTISPSTAASIALRVYDIRKSDNYKGAFHPEFRDNFKVTNNQIQGISGGLLYQLLNKSTGFALTAESTSPQFKGHQIIGIRGTKFSSIADWLTNGNVTVTQGQKNLEVHSGFQKAFASMKPAFEQYITHTKPKCLHVVGHSLGGAIAELTANWASELGFNTNLYTFGSPRVLITTSAPHANTTLNHYRVTHSADPVPNVPLWPFGHTVGEYLVAKGGSMHHRAHSMDAPTPGYINTVSPYKDYRSMEHTIQPIHYRFTTLQYEDRHLVSFSKHWEKIITDGLLTYLKKAGLYGLMSVQAVAMSGLSFYDILARSLYQSTIKSVELAEELRGLLGHMLVFVGKGAQAVKEMSEKFIRWVFGLMIKALYTAAKYAIDLVS